MQTGLQATLEVLPFRSPGYQGESTNFIRVGENKWLLANAEPTKDPIEHGFRYIFTQDLTQGLQGRS
jgi:hypothetical protein